MDRIHFEVEAAVQKYGTRDPYELLDCLNVITKFSTEFAEDGLKGFAAIIKRRKYAVINDTLCEHDKRVVAGHEASHFVLHEPEILSSRSKALRDFDLWSDHGRLEHEANRILSDFLIEDCVALALVEADMDYFSIARTLCVPPPLLAFKLQSMMKRGFAVRNPVDLQSDFLARDKTRAGG